MFIRRKFSAHAFLDEVRKYNTTVFIYVGELCRYLMHTTEMPNDADNPLTTMIGNGLRPDIWKAFRKRFGVKTIYEFYGASEGVGLLVNLFNRDCTVGTTLAPVAIVKYDVESDTILRDEAGHCVKVSFGEAGLYINQITQDMVFEGYSNKEASEKKILRNVFQEGDMWFNTGDLLKQVDVGFVWGMPHFQFVDRVGDTYRWKSENVSTNEVGEILNQYKQIKYSNVYGVAVPGADGKAGMAAIELKHENEELDLDAFSQFVHRELPPYARPVFVRILKSLDITGTFKLLKTELKNKGYDIQQVSDPLYVLRPGSARYEPLREELFNDIRDGRGGF